ncbi:MAG TPA: mechanosensitive ion channel domain-containing protein [Myxococcales bacterium]|nr:mechanosensitive ion channel domain-containing protein [Myxococcales bacterium]
MLLVALAIALAPNPAAGDAAPAAVPAGQLLREAENAYAELRRIADLTGPDAELNELIVRLDVAEKELQKLRAAGSSLALGGDTDYLQFEIVRRDGEARRWDDQLGKRATQLDAAEASLRRLAEIWRLTVDSLGTDVSPALRTRAVEVRDRASALDLVVRKWLTSVLELQDRVLALKLTLADLLARVQAAESARTQELFEVESTPLWRAFGGGRPLVSAARGRALGVHARTCIRYLASEPGRLAAELALLAALVGIGLVVARRLRGTPQPDGPGGPAVEVVSKRPVATAAMLALFAAPFVFPEAPSAFALLVFLIGLAPFFRVAGTMTPDWVVPLRWLAALFIVERLAALLPDLAPLGRLVLLAIELAVLAACVVGLRRGGWLRTRVQGRWSGAILAAAGAAAVIMAVAAVANVLGNVTLSELLAGATLATACGTAAVVTGVVIFTGAFRAALLLPWTHRFRIVRGHEELVVQRATALFRAASIVAWGFWTLKWFHATQGFGGIVTAALAVRLRVGALDVSLGDVVAFAVTLWLAVWASRALKFALDEAVLPALDVPRGKAVAVSTTAKYLVVALGFSFATLAGGMEVTRFTVLAGTLGVGIGFGLQNVVNNFVCGLILLYEQPVQVGDVIELGQLSGEVQRIGVRSSTVRSFQGADVIVPNSNFITAEVINWTRSDRNRRVEISVGVAYGSEPQRVQELLLATARTHPGIAAAPAPLVLLTGFGESALQFELRFWTDVDNWVATASGLRAAINDALPHAGINIPFRQLDLWVRAVPPVADKSAGAKAIAPIEPPKLRRR